MEIRCSVEITILLNTNLEIPTTVGNRSEVMKEVESNPIIGLKVTETNFIIRHALLKKSEWVRGLSIGVPFPTLDYKFYDIVIWVSFFL